MREVTVGSQSRDPILIEQSLEGVRQDRECCHQAALLHGAGDYLRGL